jgi:hypothetical protein
MKMSWGLWWMVVFGLRRTSCLHSHCVTDDQQSESVWHIVTSWEISHATSVLYGLKKILILLPYTL